MHWSHINKSHDHESVPKQKMIAKTNGGIARVHQGLVTFLAIS